ncbi:hypothetical protein ECS102511_03315 [Chlamydia trachomatis]|nr:hypothetical protein ECS102511_03315 [Chlamydia trachomatis]AKR40733.1 hypothetical protein FCS84708_03315 [Chlamydia trachomatis]
MGGNESIAKYNSVFFVWQSYISLELFAYSKNPLSYYWSFPSHTACLQCIPKLYPYKSRILGLIIVFLNFGISTVLESTMMLATTETSFKIGLFSPSFILSILFFFLFYCLFT